MLIPPFCDGIFARPLLDKVTAPLGDTAPLVVGRVDVGL